MKVVTLAFTILLTFDNYALGHPHSDDEPSPSYAAQLSEPEFKKLMADRFPSYPTHIQPKVDNDYDPTGIDRFVPSLNLTVYETDINNSTVSSRVLILIHDIFGPHNKHKQFADIVATGRNGNGFRVVMPDFFRGGAPGGPWDGAVNQTFRGVLSYYRQQYNGTEPSFGTFGFCWGGGMAVRAGQQVSEINGFGLIHPGATTTEDARTLQSPALLLPGNNDLDFDEFEIIVAQQQGIENVFHRRFTDQRHGFAGGGGNWSDPVVALRVDQVISFTIDFFDKHL